MAEKQLTIEQWHKKQAVDLFNATWDLLDKSDRTHDDDMKMIHSAHASLHHWLQIGEPLNRARGEWQVSRVYSVLNMGESALLHGQDSLDICLKEDIGGFDRAFGYEAVARAYAVLGDTTKRDEHIQLATQAAEAIEKKGDKDYTLSEIQSIPV